MERQCPFSKSRRTDRELCLEEGIPSFAHQNSPPQLDEGFLDVVRVVQCGEKGTAGPRGVGLTLSTPSLAASKTKNGLNWVVLGCVCPIEHLSSEG